MKEKIVLESIFKTIPGFPRYAISENGLVIDKQTQTMVFPTRHPRGYVCVALSIRNNNARDVKAHLARLVLMTYNPPNTKDYNPLFVSVNHLNGDDTDVRLSNLEWDYGVYTPTFVPGVSGPYGQFQKVPGYDCEINALGVVRRHGNIINPHRTSDGYANIRFVDDAGKVQVPKIHRLLALTFLEHPNDTRELIINHIDGNPTNNSLDNLEWTTYHGNIVHAYKTRLRNEAKPVLVMNVNDRTVDRYYSVGEFCSSKLSTIIGADKVLWSRLKFNAPLTPYNGYFIKYENDPREWPSADIMYAVRPEYGLGHVTEIKNIKTGEVLTFDSITEASGFLNQSAGAVNYQLSKPEPTPYFGFLVRKKTGKEWPHYTVDDLPEKLRTHAIKIVTKNVHDGNVIIHDSANKAGIYLAGSDSKNSNSRYVLELAQRNSNVPFKDHYLRMYSENIEWPESVGSRLLPIVAKNVDTGDITVYKNANAACKRIGSERQCVADNAVHDVPVLINRHLVRYYSDNVEWPKFWRENRNYYTYEVICPNNETKIFTAIQPVSTLVRKQAGQLVQALQNGSFSANGYTITRHSTLQSAMSVAA